MKKDKTISFRINEDSFEDLQTVAENQNLSLSAIFRDYVEEIIDHSGEVEVVAEHEIRDEASDPSAAYPPTVEVSKHFVREHERLELECQHLRDRLEEYKRQAGKLEADLEARSMAEREMVRLEEVDFEAGTSILIE